jgi:hypothetical protein
MGFNMNWLKETWLRYAIVNIVSFTVVSGTYLEHKIGIFSASDGVAKVICVVAMTLVYAIILYYFWCNRARFALKGQPKQQ